MAVLDEVADRLAEAGGDQVGGVAEKNGCAGGGVGVAV